MKKILFAAALCASSIAFAQNTTTAEEPAATQDQPSGETVDDPSQATGPQGITQQGTDPNGQGMAPAGTNQMPMQRTMPNQNAFTPRPATTEYPPCSRTVTDACVQSYERGVGRTPARRPARRSR